MASSYRLSDITDEQYNRLLRRGASAAENVPGVAREICLDVKRRGDAALRDYTARFDGVALDKLRVADDETRNAVASQPVDVRAALEAAAENIRAFHKTQLGAVQTVETA
ncbi:MAG TPA: histidinol dehydrogenase, partial [Bacteroidota bacterium]